MQEKIIEELRQELKEQIKENKELEKKVDGLVTVIDLAKQYIKAKYDYLLGDDTFLDHDERIERKQIKHILEILERVNEE